MWQTAFSLSISKSASLHFCLTGLQLLDMKFTANFKTVHMILLVFFSTHNLSVRKGDKNFSKYKSSCDTGT